MLTLAEVLWLHGLVVGMAAGVIIGVVLASLSFVLERSALDERE